MTWLGIIESGLVCFICSAFCMNWWRHGRTLRVSRFYLW